MAVQQSKLDELVAKFAVGRANVNRLPSLGELGSTAQSSRMVMADAMDAQSRSEAARIERETGVNIDPYLHQNQQPIIPQTPTESNISKKTMTPETEKAIEKYEAAQRKLEAQRAELQRKQKRTSYGDPM